MKIEYETPKEPVYKHPKLIAGNVYKMTGVESVYFCVMVPKLDSEGIKKPHLYLINVFTGERYSDNGFSEGNAKFEDITAISFLKIGSN